MGWVSPSKTSPIICVSWLTTQSHNNRVDPVVDSSSIGEDSSSNDSSIWSSIDCCSQNWLITSAYKQYTGDISSLSDQVDDMSISYPFQIPQHWSWHLKYEQNVAGGLLLHLWKRLKDQLLEELSQTLFFKSITLFDNFFSFLIRLSKSFIFFLEGLLVLGWGFIPLLFDSSWECWPPIKSVFLSTSNALVKFSAI